MPKEAINLDLLISRVMKGEILIDRPLVKYLCEDELSFNVFQTSGLNVLLGFEGNGKTKFMTHLIIQLLNDINSGDTFLKDRKILLVDTERPESQYAYTAKHIVENTKMQPNDIFEKLALLAVSDLNESDIKEAMVSHLKKNSNVKYLIIIDHILPLVAEMNNPAEASQIDQLLKTLIHQGHIVIVSIHKPYGGYLKGLGHIGSSLQRLASFILEITNAEDGRGFKVKQVKSRISGVNKNELVFTLGNDGFIDCSIPPNIIGGSAKSEKPDKSELAKEILVKFMNEELKTKKNLFELIALACNYSERSSSINTFYNEYMKTLIEFKGDLTSITNEGKELLKYE